MAKTLAPSGGSRLGQHNSHTHFIGQTQTAWQQIEPATAFVPNWHIELICAYLEAVAAGELRRLVINVPPRTGKSLLSSVFFVPWLSASVPQKRFLYASHNLDLAEQHSRLWRFGHVFSLAEDQNQAGRFSNDKTGSRIATSVTASATDHGGEVVIIDDPHQLSEAHSEVRREAAIAWFETTTGTRLNDPKTGALVVIGQRVHERGGARAGPFWMALGSHRSHVP